MSKNDKVESMMRRILAIDWKEDWSKPWSQFQLFYEYLRRVSLWVKANYLTDTHSIMGDIPLKLLPSVRAGDDKLLLVENHLKLHGANSNVRNFCTLALHWAAIEDTPEVMSVELPAPYEPLLILFERGGWITSEHGWWQVGGGGSMQKRAWSFYENRPPLNLDKDALDAIDEDGQKHWDEINKKKSKD